MHHFQPLIQDHCHRELSPPSLYVHLPHFTKLTLCSTLNDIINHRCKAIVPINTWARKNLTVSIRRRQPFMLEIGSSFISLSNYNDFFTLAPFGSQKVVRGCYHVQSHTQYHAQSQRCKAIHVENWFIVPITLQKSNSNDFFILSPFESQKVVVLPSNPIEDACRQFREKMAPSPGSYYHANGAFVEGADIIVGGMVFVGHSLFLSKTFSILAKAEIRLHYYRSFRRIRAGGYCCSIRGM